ncbi:MAG: hypothetical protein LBG74_04670 [Spirochaetaceae bacterium]|nr:hypothetical protein [Spirochaetaceae bacterium]
MATMPRTAVTNGMLPPFARKTGGGVRGRGIYASIKTLYAHFRPEKAHILLYMRLFRHKMRA